MKSFLKQVALVTAIATAAPVVYAETEIQWWHASSGRIGELLSEQVSKYNASQSDYKVVATYKGNYSETLNAGIAAFRAKEHPQMLMVFEVGTATMMGAKGAIKPVYKMMEEAGEELNPKDYLQAVTGY